MHQRPRDRCSEVFFCVGIHLYCMQPQLCRTRGQLEYTRGSSARARASGGEFPSTSSRTRVLSKNPMERRARERRSSEAAA